MTNSDLRHAKMVQRIKQMWSDPKECRRWGPESFDSPYDVLVTEIESPYNYYGDRGFVDLVVYSERIRPTKIGDYTFGGHIYANLTLWEMKTTLVDIGQTLRQIHKARLYFPKARDSVDGHYINRSCVVESYLLFSETKEIFEVLLHNLDLLVEKDLEICYLDNQTGYPVKFHLNSLLGDKEFEAINRPHLEAYLTDLIQKNLQRRGEP